MSYLTRYTDKSVCYAYKYKTISEYRKQSTIFISSSKLKVCKVSKTVLYVTI
jgi:hypothetical protein